MDLSVRFVRTCNTREDRSIHESGTIRLSLESLPLYAHNGMGAREERRIRQMPSFPWKRCSWKDASNRKVGWWYARERSNDADPLSRYVRSWVLIAHCEISLETFIFSRARIVSRYTYKEKMTRCSLFVCLTVLERHIISRACIYNMFRSFIKESFSRWWGDYRIFHGRFANHQNSYWRSYVLDALSGISLSLFLSLAFSSVGQVCRSVLRVPPCFFFIFSSCFSSGWIGLGAK